jgi:hypothetical protein
MDEPYLKSITSIESKDKEFTYLNNKEKIEDLMKFFGVKVKAQKPPNSVENPPLFNTITQQHHNTVEQQDHTTIPQYHDNTVKPQNDITTELEHNSTIPQEYLTDIESLNRELNKDFLEKDSEVGENLNESKSKIERSEDSNPFQPLENELLPSDENHKVAMVFKGLEWERPNVNPNVLKSCLDLLHNVSQSNADNYKERFAKAHNQFKGLLKGYSKEERKPLNMALNDLSRVLGRTLTNKNIKKE